MLSNLALAAAALAAGAASAGPSASTSPLLPAAAVSDAVAAPAIAGDTVPDNATAVTISTKDGQLLSASYFAPKVSKKSTAPAPAALLIHDATNTRAAFEPLATYLQKKGFAVLSVDLRGHGDSVTAECDFDKADEKAKQNLWSLSMRDVDASADYLLAQDGIHSSNLSIFGIGAGAALAVRRASDDENVRSVILVDPEPVAFGYNVATGIAELGGLPTLIMTSKSKRDAAERLQEQAHKDNEGLEFVDISKLKVEGGDPLADSKLDTQAAAWLREKVMPKK
ncbi:Alpha/beta hydrolase family protein [Planctomycetes bacterium Poly30]|uniref:Alpha/beta hydrolase family protein n=1 Tax=Saltatorellus ferox TaxID=2528018 RepID=A0A518EUC4_9BACT|nr:Alpha/beta hydrolase family protein [Planctomycetes bacterium Poly30]